MNKKTILLIMMLISSSYSFGQIKSYDIVIDSSNNERLGDLINFERNYYQAHYYYGAMNSIDSIDKYKLPLESIDLTELYYLLISESKNNILLFFIDKLDSTKFQQYYDTILMRHMYKYKDANNLFYNDKLDGNYVYLVLLKKDIKSENWTLIKGGGTFYGNNNTEVVKKEAVASLLGNRMYFKIGRSSENPDFWNRIQDYEFTKQ